MILKGMRGIPVGRLSGHLSPAARTLVEVKVAVQYFFSASK